MENFQEYKLVVEKLRDVYFKNISSVEAIRDNNIAVLSDLHMIDSVLRTVILQANVNNGKNKSQHRNTFLFR